VVKRLTIEFGILALAVASAASGYNVTFYQPVVVNGTTLQAGDYTVEVNDNKAIIKKGKSVAETPVKLENNDAKYRATTVLLAGTQVQEIHVGGTHTKLVFDQAGVATK
jgi:hypothetical protein